MPAHRSLDKEQRHEVAVDHDKSWDRRPRSFQADARPVAIPHTYDTLIQGLGESHPDAKNLSKSSNFQVFKFTKNGVTFFQVNDNAGNVDRRRSRWARDIRIPIGSLAAAQVVVNQGMTANATATATCPCRAEVVYDPTTRIVGLYGSNGESFK